MISIIGTVASQKKLTVFNYPISISRVPAELVGRRLRCSGYLRYDRNKGAYFQVCQWEDTEEPDSNFVTVEGTIITILPPKVKRGQERACLILERNGKECTRVLITLVSSHIQAVDFNNLSLGQYVRLSGYINYHRRGLHVLFARKEGNP